MRLRMNRHPPSASAAMGWSTGTDNFLAGQSSSEDVSHRDRLHMYYIPQTLAPSHMAQVFI